MSTYRVPGDPRTFQPVNSWTSHVQFCPDVIANRAQAWRYVNGTTVPTGRKLKEWAGESEIRFIIDSGGIHGELFLPDDLEEPGGPPWPCPKEPYQVTGDPRTFQPVEDWPAYIEFAMTGLKDATKRARYRRGPAPPLGSSMIEWASRNGVRFIIESSGVRGELIVDDGTGSIEKHMRYDHRGTLAERNRKLADKMRRIEEDAGIKF